MTTLQTWFASTFARLMSALSWQAWSAALVIVAVIVFIAGFVYRCYRKALEASD